MSKVGSMGAIVLPTPQISKKRSFMVAWRHYYTLPRMLCAKNFYYCFIFVSFGFDKLPEKHKITTIHILQQKNSNKFGIDLTLATTNLHNYWLHGRTFFTSSIGPFQGVYIKLSKMEAQ